MVWTQQWPAVLTVVGGIGGLAVWLALYVGGRTPEPRLRELTYPSVVAMACFCLLVPAYRGLKKFPGRLDNSHRASTWSKLEENRGTPSVVDWRKYYAYLRTTMDIDIPWEVLQDLRRIIPPQQVVIFDPRESILIPFLMNQYIVNPGVEFSTDMAYYRDYVKADPAGGRIHPVYNHSEVLTEREREFMDVYGVDYILVNPTYAATVKKKLADYSSRFHLVYEKDGFLLYESSAVSSRTARAAS
jgi:hypothetical protein